MPEPVNESSNQASNEVSGASSSAAPAKSVHEAVTEVVSISAPGSLPEAIPDTPAGSLPDSLAGTSTGAVPAAAHQIIKDRAVVDDDWTVLRLAEGETPEAVKVPAGRVIVPLKVWQAQREALSSVAEIGVWLAGDEPAQALREDLDRFAVVAVNFAKFSDGRGYSTAYNLRVRLNYQGELRAIGDVLRDQLFYMQRVGFNAFATRPDRNIHDALKGLTDFSESYQTSVDQKTPLFRRVARQVQPVREASAAAQEAAQ